MGKGDLTVDNSNSASFTPQEKKGKSKDNSVATSTKPVFLKLPKASTSSSSLSQKLIASTTTHSDSKKEKEKATPLKPQVLERRASSTHKNLENENATLKSKNESRKQKIAELKAENEKLKEKLTKEKVKDIKDSVLQLIEMQKKSEEETRQLKQELHELTTHLQHIQRDQPRTVEGKDKEKEVESERVLPKEPVRSENEAGPDQSHRAPRQPPLTAFGRLNKWLGNRSYFSQGLFILLSVLTGGIFYLFVWLVFDLFTDNEEEA